MQHFAPNLCKLPQNVTKAIVRADDREIPATVFWHEPSTPN